MIYFRVGDSTQIPFHIGEAIPAELRGVRVVTMQADGDELRFLLFALTDELRVKADRDNTKPVMLTERERVFLLHALSDIHQSVVEGRIPEPFIDNKITASDVRAHIQQRCRDLVKRIVETDE